MIKPKKIYWDKSLVIVWPDNSETKISFVDLRNACACAECVDELSGLRKIDPSKTPKFIDIKDCHYVGNYSLRFFFSDNHAKGIYTFDYLKSLSSNKT